MKRIVTGSLLFTALLAACSHQAKLGKVEQSNVQMNRDSKEDADALSLIAPYKEKMKLEMEEVLIRSENAAVKDQPEGTLGNVISDIVLKQGNAYAEMSYMPKADICLLNNGGLRTSLPKGEITVGKIYELMPFENQLVVLTLSGPKTLELFRFLAAENGMPLAGATLKIKKNRPVSIRIQQQELDTMRSYRVITSDYLANGGDKMRFFNNPQKTEMLNHKIRDAIIEYLREENKKGNTLKPLLDGRISYE